VPTPIPRTTVVLARHGAEVAAWPLPGADHPDLAMIDELAGQQLAARRLGCSIRLRGASPELCRLLDLAGLTEAVIGREAAAEGIV
jgi:anti-anti-sigma regulatory factor